MAELDDADIRSDAALEAAAQVSKARADAEKHRHDTDQAMIAKRANPGQRAARRQSELHARERHLAEQFTVLRGQAGTW